MAGLSGTYTTRPINLSALPSNLRVKWIELVPLGTSIKIETSVADANPIIWVEQVSGYVISNIPEGDLTGKYLWIRATLSTTDAHITPTLSGLWLETVA